MAMSFWVFWLLVNHPATTGICPKHPENQIASGHLPSGKRLQKTMGKSPFLIGKYNFFLGKSPFLMGI